MLECNWDWWWHCGFCACAYEAEPPQQPGSYPHRAAWRVLSVQAASCDTADAYALTGIGLPAAGATFVRVRSERRVS